MKKLILALDVSDGKEALGLVRKLSPYVDLFKVGPILFLREGKDIISQIRKLGKEVFLDLKFHDIPATVQRSVESARELGVYSLTVHASGGKEMLSAAASVKDRPRIWAVTVLTSENADPSEVVRRARLARECGLDGVIASPHEIKDIKNACGKDFTVVTPGVRFEPNARDDQKRVASPSAAVSAGADFIVVGRPIIQSGDPLAAAKKIAREVGE